MKINDNIAAGKKKKYRKVGKKTGNTRIKQGKKLQARIQKERKTLNSGNILANTKKEPKGKSTRYKPKRSP